MKYVLARTTHSAGLHYDYFGNDLMSSMLVEGTPHLSDAYMYDSEREANDVLTSDTRLQYSSYFVAQYTDKEIFEAKLAGV